MPILSIESTLVRPLGTIGGRSLIKTSESMLSSVVRNINSGTSKAEYKSNGHSLALNINDKEVLVSFDAKDPKVKNQHYVYQDGVVIFEGEKKQLELIKNNLVNLAEARKDYLLYMYKDEDLKKYKITKEFIVELPKKVSSLRIIKKGE